MTREQRRGLAPQRTVLAWQRTAIGCGLLGAGMLKLGLSRGQVVEWVAASWLIALAALLGTIAWQRRRAGTADVARRHHELVAVTGGVLVAAALLVAAVATAA